MKKVHKIWLKSHLFRYFIKIPKGSFLYVFRQKFALGFFQELQSYLRKDFNGNHETSQLVGFFCIYFGKQSLFKIDESFLQQRYRNLQLPQFRDFWRFVDTLSKAQPRSKSSMLRPKLWVHSWDHTSMDEQIQAQHTFRTERWRLWPDWPIAWSNPEWSSCCNCWHVLLKPGSWTVHSNIEQWSVLKEMKMSCTTYYEKFHENM